MSVLYKKCARAREFINVCVPRQDIPYILILLSLTIITRLLLIMNAPFVYHIDSYAYMSKAIDFASKGAIQFEIGMPFIFFLGSFFKIFGFALGVGPILVSRFLMLLMASLLVLLMYLFGLRMSGRMLGFSAALLAVFEPYFLSYSIVPHIDVFAITMGMIALYFARAGNKSRYILAPIFFYLAAASKVELYLALIIPILIFSFYKKSKIRSIRGMITIVLVIFVYVLPAIWMYPRTVLGRFSVIERFSLFLKPELLKVTLDSSFGLYDQPFLNQVFFGLVGAGLALGLLNIISKFISFGGRGRAFLIRYKRNRNIRDILNSDKIRIALCLFLFFVIHFIILTTYGFGYVVTDETITITPNLPERYLILPRLLMSYPLVYPLSLITKKACACMANKKKDSQKRPHYLGYLKERPKDTPIPNECLTCPETIECLLG